MGGPARSGCAGTAQSAHWEDWFTLRTLVSGHKPEALSGAAPSGLQLPLLTRLLPFLFSQMLFKDLLLTQPSGKGGSAQTDRK